MRERPFRLRLDRAPPPGQEGWGTWIANLTLPPAPEVYVSFMAPAFPATTAPDASSAARSEPVAVTRVTAHPAPEAQPVRPRPRASGISGAAPASSASTGGASFDAPEADDIDAAFMQPGTTRPLHKLEQHLFRSAATVTGMPAARGEVGEPAAATWTDALRSRHVAARQVNPAQMAAPGTLPPSTSPISVDVQKSPDLSPWSPLGRIALELLAAGSV